MTEADIPVEIVPGVRLRFLALDDMTARELHDLLKLRFDVFVMEQQSLYPEIDGRDVTALHAFASAEGEQAPAGTLRVLGLDGQGPVWIGRVAIRRDMRGVGLGRALMRAAVEMLDERAPGRPQRLGAQEHLESYYAGFGFTRISGVYDDGGVPHVDMEREPR